MFENIRKLQMPKTLIEIKRNKLPPNYPFAPHQSESWPSYVYLQPPNIEHQNDASFYIKPGQNPFRKPGILGLRPPKKDLDCWFCGKMVISQEIADLVNSMFQNQSSSNQ